LSKKEFIRKRIQEKTKDNRISCRLLRRIAEEAGVPYREAGETANELKVKIKNCELGCF
jgi:LAO/AO transport system kinase